MKIETKTYSTNSVSATCQNCQKDFTIEPEDFGFYEKIKVPPPTWCPECRMIRRMNFRNERSLYKQNCDLCKKSIFSMYDPKDKYIVYCNDCFNSDKWNPVDCGQDYDFSRSFFEQHKELSEKVPHIALFDSKSVNARFCNMTVEMKK